MPALLSSGNRQGTTVSDAYQIPVAWDGLYVSLEIMVPANNNVVGRSVTLTIDTAEAETGPWIYGFGMSWSGGRVGKISTDWNTGQAWPFGQGRWVPGLWVRATLVVPVRTRFGVDLDLSDELNA